MNQPIKNLDAMPEDDGPSLSRTAQSIVDRYQKTSPPHPRAKPKRRGDIRYRLKASSWEEILRRGAGGNGFIEEGGNAESERGKTHGVKRRKTYS